MKLLCPTDFSKPAAEAADVAAALSAKRRLPLQLAYCAADWVISAEVPVIDPRDQAAPQELESEARRLRTLGANVEPGMLMGTIHHEIAKAAENETEMIVMGSTGKGAAERWLVGSVAERVAESAPVPTLVVRDAKPLLAWLRNGYRLRVLCAVDFTMSADAAVAAVKRLQEVGPLEIEAAYLPTTGDRSSRLALEEESPQRASLERDVWERLQGLLGDVPVKVHIRSSSGSPAFDFVLLADELKADLIIVGSHQRHGLQRLAGPSFSRGLLEHASTNVLCVPVSSYKPEFSVPVIRRVLVATDLSPSSDAALRYACGLLPSGGALELLHVTPSPTTGLDPLVAGRVFFDHSLQATKATTAAEEKLRTLLPRQLVTGGITTNVRAIEHDNAAVAICEHAERFGADVICMGTRGHSAAASAVLGSVAQNVIARSHRPVLVVPPPLL